MEQLLIGIGDLHGHYPALEKILYRLQEQYSIFSDNMVLQQEVNIVFTGDYIDRGSQSLKIINTLKTLQSNNTRIHTLFGNHELLALSDASNAANALTYDDRSLDMYRQTVHGNNGGVAFVQEFASTPKEAMRSYVQRISREGDVGLWIRKLKPLVLQEQYGKKILFVHGGIPKTMNSVKDLEAYAQQFSSHMSTNSTSLGKEQKYREHPLVGGHSVFWDRELPYRGEHDPSYARNTAARIGVDYIVIGHTPQEKITMFGNCVFDIDVGMTPAYGEREPCAIIFKKTGVYDFGVEHGERIMIEH